MISKKRASPSVEDEDDDVPRRARKRRSPLPVFDSDSTPEATESSSDESIRPVLSQQIQLETPPPEPAEKPARLTLKLRGMCTIDLADSPTSSRPSSPAPTKVAPGVHPSSHTATVSTVKTATPATS